jgi:stress response protein YsnF
MIQEAPVDAAGFEPMTTEHLRERAADLGLHGAAELSRDELIAVLADADAMTRSEERLVASTELWETGRARLRKYVVTEDVQITVQVRREELRFERESIPAGSQGMVEDPDVFGPAEVFETGDGGVIFEVTLHEERPVIGTEIVPVERVRLTKVVHTDERVVTGQVRKERIEVDLPNQPPETLG